MRISTLYAACMKVNFSNFHILLSEISWKQRFYKEVSKDWFHETFFSKSKCLVFPHCTALWKGKFALISFENIPWNQFAKKFDFTEKNRRAEIDVVGDFFS